MSTYRIAKWGRGPHHVYRGNASVTLCGIGMYEYVGYLKTQRFYDDFNEITCPDCRNMYLEELVEDWQMQLAALPMTEEEPNG